MALFGLDGRFTEVNNKLCDLLGYSGDELLGVHLTELTYPDDAPKRSTIFADLVEGRQDAVCVERRYRHKHGYPLWMVVRSTVVSDTDDRPAYIISQFETTGTGRIDDRHLVHMALYEPLTGLANRILLLDRLDQGLTELPHKDNGVLAVLLIDLGNLKPTNDRYDHAAGDTLLTTTADELLNSVRAGDTVARLGSNEFVVLTKVDDFAAAEALRQGVAQCLNIELTVSGQPLSLRASLGLATTQNPNICLEALLHSADRDMYIHKRDVVG